MVGNGVIFVASGVPYVRAANLAARSVKEHAPSLAVDLFTDAPESAEEVFNQVHPIEGAHIRSKVDHMCRSRFDRTLYLDTDTRVVADISDMFAILDRFDLALAHSHARNRKETRAVWRVELSDAFPQLNSGVMLFKSSPAVLAFLQDWGKAYHLAGFKKDQVTLRELLWASDLRLHVLPPEYNIRYEKYLRVWNENEATPRILHFAAFHGRRAREAKGSARPWAWRRYPRTPLLWLRRLISLSR